MATTRERIKHWIDERPAGTKWMIVATDKYDFTDYPVYAYDENERNAKIAELFDPNKMTKVMEVYSFTENHTIEDQLAAKRAWSLD